MDLKIHIELFNYTCTYYQYTIIISIVSINNPLPTYQITFTYIILFYEITALDGANTQKISPGGSNIYHLIDPQCMYIYIQRRRTYTLVL